MKDFIYILDKDHNVIEVDSFEELARWQMENPDWQRVARDRKDGVTVSTVFLGVNYNWDADGVPIVFETMVFGGEHGGDMFRYCTWDEALAGHDKMCALVGIIPNEVLHAEYIC